MILCRQACQPADAFLVLIFHPAHVDELPPAHPWHGRHSLRRQASSTAVLSTLRAAGVKYYQYTLGAIVSSAWYYNFLPFMVLPLYNALDKDRPERHQRRPRSRCQLVSRPLYAIIFPLKSALACHQRHHHGVRPRPDHLRDFSKICWAAARSC